MTPVPTIGERISFRPPGHKRSTRVLVTGYREWSSTRGLEQVIIGKSRGGDIWTFSLSDVTHPRRYTPIFRTRLDLALTVVPETPFSIDLRRLVPNIYKHFLAAHSILRSLYPYVVLSKIENRVHAHIDPEPSHEERKSLYSPATLTAVFNAEKTQQT